MRIVIKFTDNNIINNTSNSGGSSSSNEYKELNSLFKNKNELIDLSNIDHKTNGTPSNLFNRLLSLISENENENTKDNLNNTNSNSNTDNLPKNNSSRNGSNHFRCISIDFQKDDKKTLILSNEEFRFIKNKCIQYTYRHDIILFEDKNEMHKNLDLEIITIICSLIYSVRNETSMNVEEFEKCYKELFTIEKDLRVFKPILHIEFFVNEVSSINEELNSINIFYVVNNLSCYIKLSNEDSKLLEKIGSNTMREKIQRIYFNENNVIPLFRNYELLSS